MNRRQLLTSASALAAAAMLPGFALAAGGKIAWVAIENFSAAGKDLGVANVPKVFKSEADWKKQLDHE